MSTVSISTDSCTEEVTVREVEVEEYLVQLLCRIAETGTRELCGDVVDHTGYATAVVNDVKTMQQATARGIEVALFKGFTTLFSEDFRFLEDFGLRGVNGERGITDTHVTQVEIHMLVEDGTIVAEPVTDNRVVVLIEGTLPILVQTQLDVDHGLGARAGGQAEVHIRECLVFLSRRFASELVGRSEGTYNACLSRTVDLKAKHSRIKRIQLFQQGFLLRHNLSLVVSGKSRCCRESYCGGQ